jgi:hypothetical protein
MNATHAGTTWFRRLWPAVAGVAMAAGTAIGLAGGADLAPILAASGLIYLGAAAIGRRAAAWPVFVGTFVVIGIGRVVGGPDATWYLLALAALAGVYGLVRGMARGRDGVRQAVAMVVVGAVAVATLTVGGAPAGYLVAAGLLGHAAWDAYHHRIDRVVVRSMAEFCFVLDILVAVAMIVVTARG